VQHSCQHEPARRQPATLQQPAASSRSITHHPGPRGCCSCPARLSRGNSSAPPLAPPPPLGPGTSPPRRRRWQRAAAARAPAAGGQAGRQADRHGQGSGSVWPTLGAPAHNAAEGVCTCGGLWPHQRQWGTSCQVSNTRNTRPPTHPLQLAQWLVGGERIALASGALKASVIASVTNQKGLALALCSGQARRGWAGGIQAGMWMRKGGMLISANTRQAPAAKPQGQWGC
jgi:hypothetical protein